MTMSQECACLCAAAGHYGICRVDAEPGLVPRDARYVLVAGGELCRGCYRAQLPRERSGPAACGGRLRARIAG
ncbi:hypothetical protein LWP59_23925 [Amycolatopsis acidiphila]|uniref:Uncharacterized protein n=1 Tax=Amycolatopsis acidiphila TaxID=715473 RepID=A0A558AA33_9PSEU|nr:hypothetical protein [Amycolatopsis acidiphila]TVT21117.1 hypothetical protein FNH06_17970 [Amycolatopsis acidiphila]UIJ57200.1 hypothetical protein LWP59_23925 [Amycolatopsis acidiphila]GHG52721.1 hypothetical protein GCM10017788_00950 [Amycolatopsis acidiphila]